MYIKNMSLIINYLYNYNIGYLYESQINYRMVGEVPTKNIAGLERRGVVVFAN